MEKIYNEKVVSVDNVFTNSFLDAKILYVHCFNRLPCINFMSQVDGEKILAAVLEKFAGNIRQVLQRQWYKKKNKLFQFEKTILVFDNNCLLELEQDYCEIYHDGNHPEFIEAISRVAVQFRERQRRQPCEINLVVQAGRSIDLKAMEIKRTKLDLGLYYEDDFLAVDEIIRKRISKKNDKGIVLLHGLPGTGKTTYLRWLVGKIKKRVLFLAPSVAGNLMNPDFIELLADNPNTVLIIEDAENILMDRRYTSGSAASNLLNISDGLLSDFLNVQLICTFNSSLTMVDSALMRKGRLIARYEFGKLGIAKAQRLSRHLGYDMVIDKPMTIAEIANPFEADIQEEKMEIVGFRRQAQVAAI